MTGRQETKVSDGPGPGKYVLEKPENPAKLLEEKLRESKRMRSNQPRYIESVYKKNQREVKDLGFLISKDMSQD